MTDETAVATRDEFLAELSEIMTTAESLTIATPTEYEAAAELLQRLKGAMKRSEDARKTLVKPLNDEVSRINGEFRPVKQRQDQVEAMLKRAIRTYNVAQE